MKIIKHIFLITLFTSTFYFAQNGFVYTYYSSGEVEGTIFFANNVREGTSYWYHKNGNIKAEKTFSNGRLHGLVKEFYDTGLMKSEISIKYGVRDGISRYFYENGALKQLLSFENGVLIKEVNIDYDPFYIAPLEAYKYANTQARIKENEYLFICEGADICPKPVGGMNEVIKHLVFPEHAKLYGLEGFVTVVVTVDTLGIVEKVDVLDDIGLGTKEAAISAVKASRFLPGEKNGKRVRSKVLFKIPFSLNNQVRYANVSKKTKVNIDENYGHNIIAEVKEKKEIISEAKLPAKIIEDKFLMQNFTCNIDVCAKPRGGIKLILENFIMPAVVKRKRLEGNIVVEVTVDIYGIVRDTKVLSGIGYGCNIAVEVAILKTEFEPGLKNGEPKESVVVITVPIKRVE